VKRSAAAALGFLVLAVSLPGSGQDLKVQQAAELSEEARRTQDPQRKVELLEKAVSLSPTAEMHMDLGTAYSADALARFHDARKEYRTAYEMMLARGDRKIAALLLARIAAVHAMEGHSLDAAKVLEAAVKLDPSNSRLAAELTKQRFALTARTMTAADINRGFETTREFDLEATGPSIDLYVNFEFDSDRLTERGTAQADELGKALSAGEHEGQRFEVTGHTDRVGSDAYNFQLSKRRAMTVKQHLTDKFHVPAHCLTAIGMGKRRLLQHGTTPEDDAINRRVQVRIVR
jgi:outer membrane protein OmpA-like peptidoglycan-associated protein